VPDEVTQLILEQALNGLQFGLMLFLLAAGLTLVFGIMDMVNLAHGSLYMAGAYVAASVSAKTGSFPLAVGVAILATALLGGLLEVALLRRLYRRDHLSQVLATFALILVANDGVRMIWGDMPMMLSMPEALSGPVEIGWFIYPSYRLLIIGVGVAAAAGLYWLVSRTKLGMWVRAGASNREMARAMGINVRWLFTFIFAIGAALCALAGALLGPLLAVQAGMGENILILTFVVIVIGGIGSVRGALAASLIVGMADTLGRALLPALMREMFRLEAASSLGPALASILIYMLMAAILFWRPEGLFPARS